MRLRPVIAASATILMATATACAAAPIEIPLTYLQVDSAVADRAKLAAIAIADHDLLAPGAAPPQASLEAGTTAVIHGISAQDSGFTVEGSNERRPQIAGRHFIPTMNGRYALELTGTLATAKEAYVLIDYFDDMTSATQLELLYLSGPAPGEQESYERIPGPVFSGSGTWKRYQIHVPDPGFLKPSRGKSSRQFEFYPSEAAAPPLGGLLHEELLSAQPPGNWKLPTFEGPPTFVLADFAGRKCLFAFDRTNAKDRFCSRLRFDSNGDGDLTNDDTYETTPASWERPGGESWSAWFGIDTSVTLAGATHPYCFAVSVLGEARGVPLLSKLIPPDTKVTAIRFRPLCYYGGEFALAGKRYRISLSDSNANARFGEYPHANDRASTETGAHYLGGDILALTTGESLGAGEILTFSPYLHLEGMLFETELRLAEGKLLLKPTAEKLYPLQLAAPVRTITLVSDDFRHSVAALDPGEQLSVPAGKYGFSQYSRGFTENASTSWTLAATLARPVPTATVGPDAPNARLAFGEPYAPYVEAIPSPDEMKDPDVRKVRVELSFKVRGMAGETVKTPRRQGHGQTRVALCPDAQIFPREPEYRVATAEGELVTQGSFRYG